MSLCDTCKNNNGLTTEAKVKCEKRGTKRQRTKRCCKYEERESIE